MSLKPYGESSPSSQGLRRIIQDRLMKDVFGPCSAEWSNWMILILDDETTRIISNALGMYDLMENRITLAEHISKQRAPFRDKASVYLLAPTEDSIDRLIADWTPSKTLKQPLYAESIFVFFIRPVPNELFAKINKCKMLLQRLKILKEINISFLAKQARAFHLDMKFCFSDLFLTVRRPSETELMIADKLVTVCATLNEYPHIRYRASSNVCLSIANLLHYKLNEFIAKNKDWWYYGDGKHNERGRATFLLLSREDDCLSPMMHEFTYQAMVNDLLTVEDDQITFKTEAFSEGGKELVDKDVLLNDNDELWVELRASHIADVIQTLSSRIRAIVNSNTAIALGSKSNESKSLSLTQMANAIKALPEYREVMSKLSQHMHIAHNCMDIFNRQHLLDLADLEQTLATGKAEDGKVPKIADILALLEETLKKIPDSLTRLRLLAIYVLSQRGIRPSDQGRLLKVANLDEDHAQALFNLEKMGIPVIQEPAPSGKISSRIAAFNSNKLISSKEISDSEYTSSRYVCELKSILQQVAEKSLSADIYPGVVPLPDEGTSVGVAQSVRASTAVSASVRKTPSTFNRSRATDSKKLNDKPRIIAFVLGGACFSELRSAQEIMDKFGSETILGSTHFISPEDFVNELTSLP